ncbi:hypothetical protein CFIO01_05683 [Colletotrichum fioriniae PJ7]|uniref:Uncharacterized protein n=1 Tax=Colletotrichum fioriniae PJ7 TaxID=1445577 RepID=A0A010RYZ0_9PEZI|nr:hypothetical protein CFIO01_05683 [Colletotrichum fioriniae PJ7]
MASCSITISNGSNSDRTFFLLQDVPPPTNAIPNDIFTNVYQCSPIINGNGNARMEFTMKQQYFAIYGTSQEDDDGSTRVDTTDSIPVMLGPGGTLAVVTTIDGDGTNPIWDQPIMSHGAQPRGGFDLGTDNTFRFPSPNKIYVGCGASDPISGEVIPIQTWLAQPGLISQIFPRPRYYIAFGSYSPGAIVDKQAMGQVLMIDFTGAAIPSATFTLTNDGTYQPDDQVASNGVKWSFGNIE